MRSRPHSEGAPTIADFVSFMREAGFTPVAFAGPVRQGGERVLVDVLFGPIGGVL